MLTKGLAGYQIVVDRTEQTKLVRRSWKERWFSRPWKPFTYYKSVNAGYLLGDGDVMRYGDKLMMNPVTFDTMQKAIPERTNPFNFKPSA